MTNYIQIQNDIIVGRGQCKLNNIECIEVSQEIYDNFEQYIYSDGEIVINPELDNIILEEAKDEKIKLNDELRDTALLGGITYKDILFDSDTDQKINLLSTVETLSDEDTIVWYGMNNEPLLCNKEDLYNIGYLIKELTTYCWTHNAEIKQAIQNAETLEELEAIEINYNREEE